MRILSFLLLSVFCFLFSCTQHTEEPISDRPNVVLIITDDQGYGDLGFNGNPHVQTPNLDRFAGESIRMTNFYVSPVCAPTRSSLMTGRYSLRTGVTDTYNGGAIMSTNEVTIAEVLKSAGYKSGAFGKWHLGDNFPSRPNDQGFDESLIHLSGGMGQVGDFTTYFQRDSSYFNPVLWHNGEQEAYEGYCSDIFTDEALQFIEDNQETPFFCYLSFNAPHTPLQVPQSYLDRYQDIDPTTGFDPSNLPEMSERDKEAARKVYAMVSNIDDNFGKLMDKLEELAIADNTIVIFMTDNGPQQRRFVGGMRGRKGSVFRGGVRVPFYFKYPKKFPESKDIATSTAHLDVLPTIADLCGAALPVDRAIDGHSLLPLIRGEEVPWAERSLFFYWTRKYPELYNNIALQKGDYKLVGNVNFSADIKQFELFNLANDPEEANNLVSQEKDMAIELKTALDEKYQELLTAPNLQDPPRIVIGSDQENPVFLNRNDASGERGMWAQNEIFGYWRVHIQAGTYRIRFKFNQLLPVNGRMVLETGKQVYQLKNPTADVEVLDMGEISFSDLDCDFIPFYQGGGKNIFPFWVEMERVAD